MSLTFDTLQSGNHSQLRELMLDYYRAFEDGAMAEVYVDTVLELVQAGTLDCRMASEDGSAVGFVVFAKDKKATDFTEIPGHGTIMDISVLPELRLRGLGTQIVREAERCLLEKDVQGFYICAYEQAAGFWEKCGYRDLGEEGTNGLPLYQKPLN